MTKFVGGAVLKMVEDQTVSMVAQPEVKSIIAGDLTNCDTLMSPVAKFDVTTVK